MGTKDLIIAKPNKRERKDSILVESNKKLSAKINNLKNDLEDDLKTVKTYKKTFDDIYNKMRNSFRFTLRFSKSRKLYTDYLTNALEAISGITKIYQKQKDLIDTVNSCLRNTRTIEKIYKSVTNKHEKLSIKVSKWTLNPPIETTNKFEVYLREMITSGICDDQSIKELLEYFEKIRTSVCDELIYDYTGASERISALSKKLIKLYQKTPKHDYELLEKLNTIRGSLQKPEECVPLITRLKNEILHGGPPTPRR